MSCHRTHRALVRILPRTELRPHPLLDGHPTARRVVEVLSASPAPNEEGLEHAAQTAAQFEESISDHGIIKPLDVCPDEETGTYLILDGRHRFEASTAESFRCIVHPAEEAEEIILALNFDSKKMSSEKKAWLIVSTYPALAEVKNRRGGRPPKNWSETDRFSVSGFSERYRVRKEVLVEAAATYRAAVEKDKLEWASARVWAGLGLGAIRAGLAGESTSAGQAKPKANYFSILDRSMASLTTAFKAWKGLPIKEKASLATRWETLKAALPEDLRL